ncbi:hypothetical protein VNI00_014775 [Paramarasmius palmivorus]|uniref:Uncharacterized protein n=1 Tax=Paramarasmius palmivorus TaxID=297713 RepID=A0AAW0BP67_9AGAR
MSVYGLYNRSANYTVDFIIDGSNEHRKYPQDNPVASDGIRNYNIYGNTTLTPGNHTLIVNITSVSSDAYFYLDYITYTPSFSFIHQKPTFVRKPEDQQLPPSSSASVPPSLPTNTSPPTKPLLLSMGALVGIVIAGLSMVIFAGLFKCFWKKRSASRKEAKITSRMEPFATRFASDVKSRPNKWRELFPSEDMESNAIEPRGEGSSHLASLRVPEVQFRMDSLTAEIQNSDDLTRRELLARNNMLTMEVERLIRENAPPEYGGSVVGLERSNSHSGTLPSYNYREGSERS